MAQEWGELNLLISSQNELEHAPIFADLRVCESDGKRPHE